MRKNSVKFCLLICLPLFRNIFSQEVVCPGDGVKHPSRYMCSSSNPCPPLWSCFDNFACCISLAILKNSARDAAISDFSLDSKHQLHHSKSDKVQHIDKNHKFQPSSAPSVEGRVKSAELKEHHSGKTESEPKRKQNDEYPPGNFGSNGVDQKLTTPEHYNPPTGFPVGTPQLPVVSPPGLPIESGLPSTDNAMQSKSYTEGVQTTVENPSQTAPPPYRTEQSIDGGVHVAKPKPETQVVSTMATLPPPGPSQPGISNPGVPVIQPQPGIGEPTPPPDFTNQPITTLAATSVLPPGNSVQPQPGIVEPTPPPENTNGPTDIQSLTTAVATQPPPGIRQPGHNNGINVVQPQPGIMEPTPPPGYPSIQTDNNGLTTPTPLPPLGITDQASNNNGINVVQPQPGIMEPTPPPGYPNVGTDNNALTTNVATPLPPGITDQASNNNGINVVQPQPGIMEPIPPPGYPNVGTDNNALTTNVATPLPPGITDQASNNNGINVVQPQPGIMEPTPPPGYPNVGTDGNVLTTPLVTPPPPGIPGQPGNNNGIPVVQPQPGIIEPTPPPDIPGIQTLPPSGISEKPGQNNNGIPTMLPEPAIGEPTPPPGYQNIPTVGNQDMTTNLATLAAPGVAGKPGDNSPGVPIIQPQPGIMEPTPPPDSLNRPTPPHLSGITAISTGTTVSGMETTGIAGRGSVPQSGKNMSLPSTTVAFTSPYTLSSGVSLKPKLQSTAMGSANATTLKVGSPPGITQMETTPQLAVTDAAQRLSTKSLEKMDSSTEPSVAKAANVSSKDNIKSELSKKETSFGSEITLSAQGKQLQTTTPSQGQVTGSSLTTNVLSSAPKSEKSTASPRVKQTQSNDGAESTRRAFTNEIHQMVTPKHADLSPYGGKRFKLVPRT